jgi:MtN3 and saliva related transmembrane protein
MDLEWQTALGLAAGFCTTIAFVPQVLKTWRSRSAADLSLGTFSVFVVGLALWLVYGLVRGDVAMTAANAVTLPLAGAILYFKLRYG